MTVTALLAALSYFICYGGNWLLGQCMIERPIVVGAVTGLLLGDLPTGLIMGASLEAIFMGSVNIGGQISAEPAAATVFAVTFATMQTVDANAALAIAVPIGILSAFVSMFINNIALTRYHEPVDTMTVAGKDSLAVEQRVGTDLVVTEKKADSIQSVDIRKNVPVRMNPREMKENNAADHSHSDRPQRIKRRN